MSAPVAAGSGPVVGDGTTVMLRARSRWERARWPLAAVVTFVVLVGVSALLQARTSSTPLAPDNPGPEGARAVAEILRDQGVDVRQARSVDEARALAQAGTTLLVAGTGALLDDEVADVADVAADVVVVDPVGFHVPRLTDGRLRAGGFATGLRDAACTDPDARAAERVDARGELFELVDGTATLCFPGEAAGTGAYAVVELDGRTLTLVADGTLLSNDRLADDGNAALALRALGRHATLVWLVPTLQPPGDLEASPSYLPDWAGPVALQLAVLVLVLGIWRGRRLGRIVVEPLPVTVRAAEATVGRGRLYRRARAHGHAAAALRAGVASRTATRLGLPRAAGAADVIDATARATGRPPEQVAGLLYGPPPTDDAGLLQLSRQLDQLESEVHRT